MTRGISVAVSLLLLGAATVSAGVVSLWTGRIPESASGRDRVSPRPQGNPPSHGDGAARAGGHSVVPSPPLPSVTPEAGRDDVPSHPPSSSRSVVDPAARRREALAALRRDWSAGNLYVLTRDGLVDRSTAELLLARGWSETDPDRLRQIALALQYSPDPEVLSDPRVLDFLGQLARERPGEVGVAGVNGVARIALHGRSGVRSGASRDLLALVDEAASVEGRVRAALRAGVADPSDRAATERIIEIALDPEEEVPVRRVVIGVLWIREDPRVPEILLDTARDLRLSPSLREAAVRSLASLRDASLAGQVRDLAVSEPDDQVRQVIRAAVDGLTGTEPERPTDEALEARGTAVVE